MSTSDEHLRTFVADWKSAFNAVKRGECEMDTISKRFLDEHMVLRSPVVHKLSPANNANINRTILKWVTEVIEGFHYKDIDYFDGNTNRLSMIFGGKVKDLKTNKHLDIEGIDLITLNENDKVIELRVMIRPLNALIVFANAMKARFKGLNKHKL